jgi:hypothetical protein
VVHVVVVILSYTVMVDNITKNHEQLLCQTLNSTGRKYNNKKHEALLCHTMNSNGRQYNNHNYNYCLWFDREVVHVVVVIFSTSTVYGLTEKWFMLWLLYCPPVLFKV